MSHNKPSTGADVERGQSVAAKIKPVRNHCQPHTEALIALPELEKRQVMARAQMLREDACHRK